MVLGRLKRALDRVIDWTTIGLMAVLAAVVVVAVVTRYFLNLPLAWSEEVSRYSFIWATFLGAAICLREGTHLSVDLLVRRLSPDRRRHAATAARVLMALLLGIVLYSGIEVTRVTHAQQSPALGIPMSWVYLAVPVGATLMLLELAIPRPSPSPAPSDRVGPPA
jgi:TRAP-type C4-dicarboxylate transport system permease small subunit